MRKIPAAQVVSFEADPGKVAVGVAGGAVKLAGRESVRRYVAQVGALDDRPTEIGASQIGGEQFGAREVLVRDIPAGEIVRHEPDSGKISGRVAAGGIELLSGQ